MADRLTALDSGFLSLESPRTPMHVGSVSIFEGGPLRDMHGSIRIEELRSVIEERMQWVPKFRKHLAVPPLRAGMPRWVDDPDFDIRHHVRLAVVPAPGSERQLRELTACLHMELLDRSRPLWEIWLVDGLADGRVAVVEKMHHSLVDGVSGVDVATATLDPTPEVRHPGTEVWSAEQVPGPMALLRAGAVETALAPARASARFAARLSRHPVQALRAARRLITSAGAAPPSALIGPRCSLNQPIGTRRILDRASIPLADAKAIGRAEGLKLNDVILSVVAGGLRRLFEARAEPVDLRPNALVPVSLRTEEQRLGLGNVVSGMIVPLPVDVADPVERLRIVAATTKRLKEKDQAGFTAALLGAADSLPPPVSALLAGLVHHQPLVNVVVTNVPGPPIPLYLLGARMQESIPIVPLSRNLDVSVGIMSYDGEVVFGLFADETTCPDVHVLAEGIEKSYAELSAAIDIDIDIDIAKEASS